MPMLDDHLVDQYLDRLGHELQATPDQEQEILREIRSHLLLAAQDLDRGSERASRIALQRFGEAGEIGQALRHVHGRARWGEALLAALPVCLLSAVAATPHAPDWIATLQIAAATAVIAARTLLGHTHWPLWGWAWLGCLPLVVPNAPPNPLWGGLAYLVILLLVRHRNWMEATLALYPLPTAWAFHRTVLVSHDVGLAGWSATGVRVLGLAMAAVWAGLLIRALRTPAGPPRIARVLEALGIVFLLNTMTVAAGRLWPTNLSPYPFTLSYLIFVTVPYALFNGLPYLLFAVLTALPAILAWAKARTLRRPPSRSQWSG